MTTAPLPPAQGDSTAPAEGERSDEPVEVPA